MLSRETPRPSSVPYADPVAMDLLADHTEGGEGLGVMYNPSQLGFTVPLIGVDTDDIGDIWSGVTSIFGGGGGSGGDPLEAITDSLPPSAIGAYEGNDGWWYDNITNRRLTHEEASKRQHQVMASYIGATVGPDGFWYLGNRKLSHTESYNLYLQKSSAGTDPSVPALPPLPMPGSGGTSPGIVPFQPAPQAYPPPPQMPGTGTGWVRPDHPGISPPVAMPAAPLFSGLSPTLLIGVGAAALLVALMAKRSAR